MKYGKVLFGLLILSMILFLFTGCVEDIIDGLDPDGNHVHTPVETPRKDPTCSSAGWEGEVTCETCGTILEHGHEISALEHTLQLDLTCSVCGVWAGHQNGYDYRYDEEKGGYFVQGYEDWRITSLTIPATFNGFPVLGFDFMIGMYENLQVLRIETPYIEETLWSFQESDTLVEVILPPEMTKIPSGWFQNCTALVTVRGENITEIEEYAFAGCTSLRNVEVAEHLTWVGAGAFQDCDLLFGSADVYYFQDWLVGCNPYASSIDDVHINDGIVGISPNAFANVQSIERVYLTEDLLYIGEKAFWCCEGLTDVYWNNGGTHIGDYAFCGSSALANLHWGDSVVERHIGNYAFAEVGIVNTLTLPEGLVSIGDYGFYHGTFMCAVLPDSLQEMGAFAFSANPYLQSIALGGGLRMIPESAFSHTGLTSVTIPGNVKEIGLSAFEECTDLKTVVLENGLERIASQAFFMCEGIETLEMPNTVSELGAHAFFGCFGLKNLTLSPAIRVIGEGAFRCCSALTHVVIPEGIEVLQRHSFCDCENLVAVQLPRSLREIGDFSFGGCVKMESLTIPEGVTTIGNYLFYGGDFADCILQEVYLPSTISYIGEGFFQGASFLKTVHFNGTCEMWETMEKSDLFWRNAYFSSGAITIDCTDGEIVFEEEP